MRNLKFIFATALVLFLLLPVTSAATYKTAIAGKSLKRCNTDRNKMGSMMYNGTTILIETNGNTITLFGWAATDRAEPISDTCSKYSYDEVGTQQKGRIQAKLESDHAQFNFQWST